jgi:RNA polymerase sigma-70 factor (ECF subfamily)
LQESLLKAFTHLNAFDEKSKFSTWLTRIAINSALMVLRKRRSHPESSSEMSKLQDSTPASDPERNIIERERDFALREAVRRLPPLLREPTEIRYLQEVSVSEVAARIRVSLAATKTRLLRARKSLIRALSEDEGLHGAVSKLERTRRSGCEDRRAAEARPQIEKRVLSQEKAIPNPWALTRRNRSL